MLALQRLRDTARAHSLLKDVFRFPIITQRPERFSAPGIFAPSPFAGHKPVTQRTLNPLSLKAFPLRGRLPLCSDNQSAAPHRFDAERRLTLLMLYSLHAAFTVLDARHASNLARMRSFRRQNAFITGHDSKPNTMRMSALCKSSFCRLNSVGKPK